MNNTGAQHEFDGPLKVDKKSLKCNKPRRTPNHKTKSQNACWRAPRTNREHFRQRGTLEKNISFGHSN